MAGNAKWTATTSRASGQSFGEAKASVLMRKFACCYAQGRPGAREFPKNVATVESPAEFFAVVEKHFPRAVAVA